MRKASIGITPEGVPSIFLCALSAIIFALVQCWPVALIFLLLTWFSCHFFRDPERVTPTEQGTGISPADGRIIGIANKKDPISGEDRMCICIFMNVFSVHVNRSPVQGNVEKIHYYAGKYFNAAWDKAALENERCAYTLRDEDGQTWCMVQIAGLIARRIVCRVAEGDSLLKGEGFGMIKFGSRVDLYIPNDYTPSDHIGEQVFAGQTIVARNTIEQ